jgi:hypothetical protein
MPGRLFSSVGRSGEKECEQARTQQCEAGSSEGKKSVGREVVIAHVAPPPPSFSPVLLKMS